MGTRGQFRGGHRRARFVATGELSSCITFHTSQTEDENENEGRGRSATHHVSRITYHARRLPLSPSRPYHREHTIRRAVSFDEPKAPRAHPAFCLSSSQRLGLHCPRPARAERRKLHV